MTRVDYTEYTDETYPTVDELNALFAAIKVVVDGKIDVRGDALSTNLLGSISVINVPPPVSAGDLLRPGDA